MRSLIVGRRGSPVLLEVWKAIPGYEGHYEVSDCGRVRSLKHRWGARTTPKVLQQRLRRDGRMDVNLTVDGKCHRFLVHVLVLTAFAGPCPLGMEALHGGSGPSCNWWPLNLRWGTRSENVRQMWAEGHRDIRGKKHPNYKHGRYVRQEQK